MAKKLGTDLTLEIDDVALGSYTEIEQVKSADFDATVNEVDCTDNDDNGVKSYLAGDEDGTFSFTMNYGDTKPTGQAEVFTAWNGKTTKAFRYRPVGNVSGADEWTFNGFITSLTMNAAHEEVVEVAVTVRITDGITLATI